MNRHLVVCVLLLCSCSDKNPAPASSGSGSGSGSATRPAEPEEQHPDDTLRGRLTRSTGVDWAVDIAVDGSIFLEPRTVMKPMPEASNRRWPTIEKFLMRYADYLGIKPGAMQRAGEEPIPEGGHVFRFVQTHGKHPVVGGGIEVHVSAKGAIERVLGRWVSELERVPTAAAITPERAVELAVADARSTAAWFDPTQMATPPHADLVVMTEIAESQLVYLVSLLAEDPASHALLARSYRIDATQGTITRRSELVSDGVPASGKGVRGYVFGEPAVRNFTVDPAGKNGYTLARTAATDGPPIRVFDAKSGALITSSSPTVWDEKAGADPGNGAAVDAMANLAKVAAHYQTKYGRNSFDGKGGSIDAYVHFHLKNWAGYFPEMRRFAFRDEYDNPSELDLLAGSTALDVVAHEYGHAIIDSVIGVPHDQRTDETLAIEEGVGDTMGAILERNWTFAEGATRSGLPLRNALDPLRVTKNAVPTIDHYADRKGGLHRTSGVISTAFALMNTGKAHEMSGVSLAGKTLLSWDQLDALVYRTMIALRGNISFRTFATHTVTFARTLNLPRDTVACSWAAVGVFTREAVRAAWGIECGCTSATPMKELPCCQGTQPSCCRKCDPTLEGHWEGDWGKISFVKDGTGYKAVYTYRSGTSIVQGPDPTGKHAACWAELPNRNKYPGIGPAEFRVITDSAGTRIDGRWKHRDRPNWLENWDVVWVSSQIPEEHKQRLSRTADFATCR